MCGICGFTGPRDPERLDRMLRLLAHRGPDGEGRYECDRATLGHRRLSIIDVAGGQQPIANETGEILVIGNGEIYNHAAIRDRLLAEGHRFRTRSDTEVLVHLYERDGARCVESLDGMFAFAIWDNRDGTLLLGRDRLGIKPLYVTEKGGEIAFASEAKALVQSTNERPRLDHEALGRYLIHRCVPAPQCLFAGIRKLLPGTTLAWRDGRCEERRYWSAAEHVRDGSDYDTDAPDRLRALLEQSVRERLMSEVPLGAYLSGGLDSSLIVALMSGMHDSPVKTFSVGFEDAGRFDESDCARRVARHFGTDHLELSAGVRDVELLKKVVWHLDEPLGDAATLPTWRMAELTKPHATVVLTGEGADEAFAGYDKYPFLLALERVRPWWPLPFGRLGHLTGSVPLRRALNYLSPSKASRWRRHLQLTSVFDLDGGSEPLFQSGSRPDILDREAARMEDALKGVPQGDPLNTLLLVDILGWLPDDLLAKVDRMTMAHGVEARVPYLDYQLIEFALGLPSIWKRALGQNKRVLRELAEPLLPQGVARRKKQGFTVPLGQWMDEGLREFAGEYLNEERWRRQGLFNPLYPRNCLGQRPDLPYNRREFWTLLFLQIWIDVYNVDVTSG